MNAEFDAPKDVQPVQQSGDTAGLSSAQSDSFKGFDNFSSIKSSMSDSSNTSLPELQLFENSQPGDTNQNRDPGQGQNPGDSPQNPDPNGRQNPGDGERNDDPRSKNQPGSDSTGKQQAEGMQADDGSKDHRDDRSKDTPPDNQQKQLDAGLSSEGKQQSSDTDGPMQPPAKDDGGSKDHADNRNKDIDGSKPGPDDPGASKQPDPDGKQKNAQSSGDQAQAQGPNAPRGGSGKTDPVKPDVMPRPEYNF